MFNRDSWREGRKYLLPLTASIVFGALIGGLIFGAGMVLARLTEITPLLLKTFGESGHADEAVIGFDRFLSGLPAGIQVFSMLQSNPRLIDLLALILSAIAPLPENVPELMLASLIAGRRLPLCPGPGPHALVADAEFALVGKVPAGERRPEGPFGDHYGYYSLQHPYPVFEVEHLARRRDAIYPATVVGKPIQEDFFMGEAIQEMTLPLLKIIRPAVVDLWGGGTLALDAMDDADLPAPDRIVLFSPAIGITAAYGVAMAARDRFANLDQSDREALIAFVNSL